MKAFTFYGQRRQINYEECPYTIIADSEEEARQIFIKAIEKGEAEKYSDDNWYSLDMIHHLHDDIVYCDSTGKILEE